MAKRPTTQARKKKRTTPDWGPKFLEELASCGIIGHAAKKAKVDRSTVYNRRDRHPEFAQAMQAALEDADDLYEETGRHLARDGSERMLIFFLQQRRYPKQSTIEHKHSGDVKHEHAVNTDPKHLHSVLGILAEIGALSAGQAGGEATTSTDEVHSVPAVPETGSLPSPQ